MIFAENQHGFEYIAFVDDKPTLNLSLFAMALFSISLQGDDWTRMRLPSTQQAMLEERERLGGKEAVGRQLLDMIDGRSTVWILNVYGYDGLYPRGVQMVHDTYYKTTGSLSIEEMLDATTAKYPGHNAVIFANGPKRKSIQAIEHAHAVVEV